VIQTHVCGRSVGLADLVVEPGEVCLGRRRVGVVKVGVLTEVGGIHRFDRFAGYPLTEPHPLDLGEMAHNAQQGKRRRRRATQRKLLATQSGADRAQSRPLGG